MKLRLFLLLCGMWCIQITASAQFEGLPIGLSPEEQLLMQKGTYSFSKSEKGIPTPPSGPLRTMAQWEEVQTLVLAWISSPSILAQIVNHAQEECEVLIACSDSIQVKNYLAGQSVSLNNVSFIQVPVNSIWIRDYAGHTVYRDDVEDVSLVEWIYNRPRPDDDVIADAHGQKKGIPVYSTIQAPYDLVSCGGNWMVDGAGTAFSSKLVLMENQAGNPYGVSAKTEAQVDTVVKKFMGIDRYVKMEVLPYDGIHHIDMHMKLLDEERLLVGEFPEGISDGPQIEANIQYVLSNFNSFYGTPYKVTRIPMPPNAAGTSYPGGPYGNAYYRTYANLILVNKMAIIPSYREEYDTIADRILRESLPGYKLRYIDVDNPGANLISGGGAIHCITNSIGVSDPLLIRHQNHPDTDNQIQPYLIDAFIRHTSGIQEATLYYSINDTANYVPAPMIVIGNNLFRGEIPPQVEGTKIYYYIHAKANSGKEQVRPIVAPVGYFSFNILEGGEPPLGITELDFLNADFNVFPNPAGAITCIDLTGMLAANARVVINSTLGQEVAQVYEGILDGNKKVFFHAKDFAPGTYIVTVSTEYGNKMRKVLVR